MSKKKKHETNGHADATASAPSTPPDTIPGAKKIGQPFTQDLPVKNTDAQQLVLAGQLSDVILEKGRVEAEKVGVEEAKKKELGNLKEKIEELEGRERELARDVHNGTHEEQVTCEEWLLPDNRVMVVRADTGECVEERTAEAEDLQSDLEFDEQRGSDEARPEEQESPGP